MEIHLFFKKLFPSIILVVASCKLTPEKYEEKKESGSKSKYYDSLKKNIIGKWGGSHEVPTLDIRPDSIYYYNRDSTYPYILNGDTLLVKYPNRDTITMFGIVSIKKDTLMLKEIDFNQTTFAFRVKN
jgi:hypothetical protein